MRFEAWCEHGITNHEGRVRNVNTRPRERALGLPQANGNEA